jgi:ubiquinol-cytochrome c reductase cytochrome b subunit
VKPMSQRLIEIFRLEPLVRFLQEHKVPPELATRKGWSYVFGFATLTAFLVQVVTGIALATTYVPDPAHVHDSLRFITYEAPLGGFLRGMHYAGASAMVALIFIHMGRVYLTASYKYPRQLSWITGVVLLFLTLLMAVTGQLLRWDENGVWTVAVAAKFASRVPLMGEGLAWFIQAGPTVGGATLSRFFALHTMAVPLTIAAFVGYHLFLLIRNGVSEWPDASRPVERRTYDAWYSQLKREQGVRYFPDVNWRELVFATLVLGIILGLALVVGARPLGAPPEPSDLSAQPMPDWFVRWYYALLYFKPRGLESFVMVYAPLLLLVGLILLPILFGTGHRSLRRRPWAVGVVAFVVISFFILTLKGQRSPWTPAYDTQPLQAEQLGVSAGPVYEGAQLFHERGCQYCHQVLGRGGQYGPDLTRVARRLAPGDITVRIVQGYGDMPAYRDVLDGAELERLLSFLRALPELQEPAKP